jgi:hypothetical protein
MKRLFTAAVLLAITTISANAQLVINEIMQSNVVCTMDDIKEFPDSWVELYNPTNATINLGNYKIGTKKDKENKAWLLPSLNVLAGHHVVIYCDKEGKEDNRLHTDFRLESGDGCVVYLFDKNTKEIVDSLPYINDKPLCKMPAPDVAFGRKTDGSTVWGYQATPTPGASNCNKLCTELLGAPIFSQKGRVSNTAFNLTLSVPEGTPQGTVIRYTTNGSEPTATSTQYTKAIPINATTVIRAKLFHADYLSPASTAQSYIFHPRTMTVPIFSVLTKDAYLNDAEIGLFANNNSKEDKKTHDWRRPVNIEMFTSEGSNSKFNQLGETRIQGGQSRANALKSMVFYANKRFDPVNKQYKYEFFPDQKPGIKKFKSFSLRDGGNDFGELYFRDLIIQRTMGENTDIDWQAGHAAVLYINGEYMGMLNIRERSNEDNIESNYGIEDMDMVEISHEQIKENNVTTDLFIEEFKGSEDKTFYNDFKTFYSETGHTLAEYEQWLDVSEYLNVMILNLFYGNIDFPGNNLVFWRPNDDDESGLPKRFRVIVKDTDFGLGLYGWNETKNTYNTIDMIYHPENHNQSWAFTEPATRLFRNMMDNQDIKDLFIDKSCVYMGDFMNGTGTGAMINKIQAEAMEEFVAHRNKYNGYYNSWQHVWVPNSSNRSDIENEFNKAKSWAQGRPNNFLQYISAKYLNNKQSIPVTINKEVPTDEMPDEVLVNGIKLTKGVFDGKLFLDRLITLEAKNNIKNDYSVTGWEIKKNGVSEEPVEGTTYNFTVPSCSKLEINAVKVHKPQVTIGQDGAVSFSSLLPLDFTDMPVEAYIVTEKDGNSFTKEQVYKVPANTGIIIEGAEGTYKIPVASISTVFDNVSNNLLWSTADAAFTVPDDGSFYYGLFYSYDQQKLGLKMQPVGETFDKGKSYLCLTQQQSKQKPEIYFDEIISGVATNIQGVNNNTWTEGQIYNLNGQRVDKNYKGVIIVNGKKVVNNRK